MKLNLKKLLLITTVAFSPLMAAEDGQPIQETTQQTVTLTFTQNGQPFINSETIGSLMNLGELHLFNKQLTGVIPESIGNLVNLKKIVLSINQLTGAIPETIGQLINLKELYLCKNQLTGEIPETIGNLVSLQSLRLSNNRLNGAIPESIFQLKNLIHLYLSTNQLSGEISEDIENLMDLTSLGLSNNYFTGKIPKAVWRLHDVDLHGNFLFGAEIQTNNKLTRLNTFFHVKTQDELCAVYISYDCFPFYSHFTNDGIWDKEVIRRNNTVFTDLTPRLQALFITEIANYGYAQEMIFYFQKRFENPVIDYYADWMDENQKEYSCTLTIHPAVNGSPREIETSEGAQLGGLVEALNARHMPLAQFMQSAESGEHPVGLIYPPSRTKSTRNMTN